MPCCSGRRVWLPQFSGIDRAQDQHPGMFLLEGAPEHPVTLEQGDGGQQQCGGCRAQDRHQHQGRHWAAVAVQHHPAGLQPPRALQDGTPHSPAPLGSGLWARVKLLGWLCVWCLCMQQSGLRPRLVTGLCRQGASDPGVRFLLCPHLVCVGSHTCWPPWLLLLQLAPAWQPRQAMQSCSAL